MDHSWCQECSGKRELPMGGRHCPWVAQASEGGIYGSKDNNPDIPNNQIQLYSTSDGDAGPELAAVWCEGQPLLTLWLCFSANLAAQGRDRGEQGGQAPHHHRQLAAALRGQRQNHRWAPGPGAASCCASLRSSLLTAVLTQLHSHLT